MIGFGEYGRKRKLGTEYQYYAFLVWLINKLVCGGWSIKKAMEAIVLNSTDLGHYINSENAEHELEKTFELIRLFIFFSFQRLFLAFFKKYKNIVN